MKKTIACLLVTLCFGLFFAGTSGSLVNWKMNYSDGIDTAGKNGKNLFIMFYTDWCGYCRKMNKETFQDKTVADLINRNFTPVQVNCEKEKKTCDYYSINGYPTIAFTDSKGKILRMAPGFLSPERMVPILKFMDSGAYKDMDYATYIQKGYERSYRPSGGK
ncbi:MAG: thioredoxin family protein [Thermodesulfobacteriota bacterium]